MSEESQATRPPTVIDALPKAELHLHLEGSIRPETAVELAARHGVALTPEEVARALQLLQLRGFLETFKWVTSFLREPDDYALITQQLCEELLRQNVVYAEITISAGVMLRRMQNVEANFKAIREVAQSVPFGACARLLFWTPRGNSAPMRRWKWRAGPPSCSRRAWWRSEWAATSLRFPPINFRPAFDLRAARGTAHCLPRGRNWRAGIGARSHRIAWRRTHRARHRRDARSRARGIARRRGASCSKIAPPAICAPARWREQTGKLMLRCGSSAAGFLERGLAVTLSTDDPAMFHTDLLTEYSKAASPRAFQQQLLKLAEQSFHAAFLPPDRQTQISSRIFARRRNQHGLV